MTGILWFALLVPLLLAATALRLALFLPLALLFFVPVLIFRPRMALKAPRMMAYMFRHRRHGFGGCSYGRRGWQKPERVDEPLRLDYSLNLPQAGSS